MNKKAAVHAFGPRWPNLAELSHFASLQFQISDFRGRVVLKIISISNFKVQRRRATRNTPLHMMPFTPSIANLFRRNHDVHLPTKMHSQLRITSISDFDCTSAFQTSHFKTPSRKGHHFRFQLRFQISDCSRRAQLKSGLRFQISDFRLAHEREIEIETSISDFRFQTRAPERNRNQDFDFRFQISDSRKGETSKS